MKNKKLYVLILIITILFFSLIYILFVHKVLADNNFPSTGKKIHWYIILPIAPLFATLIYSNKRLISNTVKNRICKLKIFQYFSIICLVVLPRIVWILLIQVEPKADFKTYHLVASSISKGEILLENYISIFPHIMGYSYALSIFYKLFGCIPIIAKVLNIMLGCGIALMLFCIGRFLENSALGYIAAIMWALWPSQIFYSVLIVSETLYTFLVLLYIYCFMKIMSKPRKRFEYIVYFVFLGILCSVCNAVRPFGLIMVISVFLYLFIFYKEKNNPISRFKLKIITSLVFLGSYCLTIIFINYSICSRLNKRIASNPIGFNTYVGANVNHGGTWNEKDSDLLVQLMQNDNYSSQDIHNILLNKAVERFKDNGLKNTALIIRKFENMWLEDTDALKYIKGALVRDVTSIFNFLKYYNLLYKLSNSYYLVVIFLCIFGCMKLLKVSSHVALFFPLLLLWGVIGVHVIVEVAGRYHYQSISILCILACFSFKE